MDWLLKQQLILKEVVHLAIQIGLAEPAKGGFPNEGTDSSTNDGDVDDLEGHIIYVSNISRVHYPSRADLSSPKTLN